MIPTINTRLSKFVALLGVLLFFTPKINLVSIQQGESAGIRVDDIIICIIFLIFIIGFFVVKRNSITRQELIFTLLIISFLISNLSNIYLWRQSNILYSIRYVEYFLFFYIGYYYSLHYDISRVIFWIILINGIVMILQMLNIVGGFASGGFSDSTSERAIGLTGGPWEIGAIINFVFSIYLFGERRYSNFQMNVIFLVTFSLILITGARMPTLANLLLFLIYRYSKSTNKIFFISSVTIYSLLIIGVLLFIPNPVTDRSANLLSVENINQFVDSYKQIQVNHPFQGFGDETDMTALGDMSWLFRISKWTYAIKDFSSLPYSWFFGLGPGLWGLALDGGWVRLITETGVIGTLIFIIFFYKAARLTKALRGVVLSLYINMIMIDIHISYKAMAFVFFTVGYYYQKSLLPKQI